MLFHSPWFSLEPYPEIALTDLLAPAAEKHRDRPAFINVDGTVHTFGQTWQACRRLGRFLQDNGIQKGDRVAIFSANCPEYFVAFYGTLFAGGVVTTLNPLYKEREVMHQLEDCGASAVFAMGALSPLVHSVREHLPSVEARLHHRGRLDARRGGAAPTRTRSRSTPGRTSPPSPTPPARPDCRRALC